MPTSIIAEPITNATTIIPQAVPQVTPTLASGMQFNPYFDWSPLLGIPAWIFVCAVFLLVLITVNASWLFKMKRLAAVRGYVEAYKKATQEDVMIWVLGKTKKLTIECLRYIDSVITYHEQFPPKITKWHHNTPFSVITVGGQPGMIVSDDFDQTRDIVSEIALVHVCERFNMDQEKLRDYFKKIGDGDTIAPITNFTDYDMFGREVLEMLFPNGLEIPAYNLFDPMKFRKYFPKGCTAGHLGGELDQEAKDLKPHIKEPGFWEKYIPFGIICGVAMVFVIAAWMVPLGK